MSFLLDTDTCSAHLKTGALTHRFIQYSGRLFLSTVSLAELYTWALRKKASPKRLQGIQDLLSDVVVLDVTPDVSFKAGEVRAGLLDQGRHAPQTDMLLAATALINGFTLVTHNTQDFAHEPGLTIVDWLVP